MTKRHKNMFEPEVSVAFAHCDPAGIVCSAPASRCCLLSSNLSGMLAHFFEALLS
jgi:hypothetical protein